MFAMSGMVRLTRGGMLQGKCITVQLKSGKEYDGILHTCKEGPEFSVVMFLARERLQPSDRVTRPANQLVFEAADILQVVAHDTDLLSQDEMVEMAKKNTGLREDASIAGMAVRQHFPCLRQVRYWRTLRLMRGEAQHNPEDDNDFGL